MTGIVHAAQAGRAAPQVCTVDDVRWELLPDDDGLSSIVAAGRALDRRLREAAVTVKQGAGRTVYRLDLGHDSYFVKQVCERGAAAAVKRWFRGGACRREFEKGRELARRGVPAVAPLAWGERREPWSCDGYLITAAVPHACSLDDYLAQHLPRVAAADRPRLRRGLIDAAARLCAAAHDAGVFHDDLHGGNLLLQLDTCRSDVATRPQLCLVDLPGVELSDPLGTERTTASLAMLCAGFWDRMSDRERLRFWRTYCASRATLTGDLTATAAAIRTAALKHARRTVGRRDRRAWGDNRDFYAIRTRAGTAYAVRELLRETVERWLQQPDRLWQAHADRPVKLSRGSLVVQAEIGSSAADGVRCVAVKRLRPKSWWKRCLAALRRGRAFEAWYLGHALLARGIATARPLAAYEPHGTLRGDGYLITEWLDGACDVHLYAWDLARRSAAERRRRVRQTAAALGALIGRLHDRGFIHRDLKANNLLVREQADGVEAFLIDLDGLRQAPRPAAAACCKDLARTALSAEMHPWLSRSDRLRFLRNYLRRYDRASLGEWKTWWRETARHATAELEQLRAAGRSVT